MEAIIQECQEAKDRGQTPEEVLQHMRRRGLTIIQAIKAFIEIYRMPLGEAKKKVSASQCWREIVNVSAPLHDQLAEDAEELVLAQQRLHDPRKSLADVEKHPTRRQETK